MDCDHRSKPETLLFSRCFVSVVVPLRETGESCVSYNEHAPLTLNVFDSLRMGFLFSEMLLKTFHQSLIFIMTIVCDFTC